MMSKLITPRSLIGVRRASSAHVQPNWLERNCGDVPVHPQTHDPEVSAMLRGGHALQIASLKLLKAQVATSQVLQTYSSAHVGKLRELQEIENVAVHRIEEAVQTKDFRFRPSLVIPAVELGSFAAGSVLSTLGDAVSTSYVTGVKMAVSDFYNDQIREIYASKSEMVELKELFKVARDEEQEFVDAHTSATVVSNEASSDPVTTFAKASLKVLAQVARVV